MRKDRERLGERRRDSLRERESGCGRYLEGRRRETGRMKVGKRAGGVSGKSGAERREGERREKIKIRTEERQRQRVGDRIEEERKIELGVRGRERKEER